VCGITRAEPRRTGGSAPLAQIDLMGVLLCVACGANYAPKRLTAGFLTSSFDSLRGAGDSLQQHEDGDMATSVK
jgi:hypothetical protein